MDEKFHCGVVLLAAGASRRMGRPKQLLPVGNKPLVRHMAEIIVGAPVAPVVVVLGAQAGEIAPQLSGLPVHLVINAGWEEGLGSSLRAGVAALRRMDIRLRGLIVALADQPGLTVAHLQELIRVHHRSGTTIVASRCAGQLMPPVFFAAEEFDRLENVGGDQGLRSLWQKGGVVAGRVDCDTLADLDTPEDYQSFNR